MDVKVQLQEEVVDLGRASQHYYLYYLQSLQSSLKAVQVVLVKERKMEIQSELAN